MHSVLKWQQPNNLSINVNQTTEDGEKSIFIKTNYSAVKRLIAFKIKVLFA